MGRLVNDSVTQRKANVVLRPICHNNKDHLCLFVAGDDIQPGTELCYYYGPSGEYKYWRKVCKCCCCTEIQETVHKAKSITAHFKHSSKDAVKLLALEEQMGLPKLKLKQECATR
jgi:hypothetical protein